jgi:ribosomal protein S18 acetylase RimI-like enzyme
MRIKEFNQVDSRKCLYVSRFAVRPDLQKSGLGSALLKLSENIARRGSYECMQLDTAQAAQHLVKYYQSQGFKIVRPIYYEGKTYISWVLEKPL